MQLRQFTKRDKEPNIPALENFIERPSQDYNEEELRDEVSNLLIILHENPYAIMNIIANHPVIPATFLLDDLAEKMHSQNRLHELNILFDKCLNDLIEACIWNTNDLKRCLTRMPAYTEKILQNILSNENRGKRILNAENNPEETLSIFIKNYPAFKSQFSEFFEQHLRVIPKQNKEDENLVTFDDLPAELYLKIFSYLTPKELFSVIPVSKTFKIMGESSLLWKRHIEPEFASQISPTNKEQYRKLVKAKKTLMELCLERIIIRKLRSGVENHGDRPEAANFRTAYKCYIENPIPQELEKLAKMCNMQETFTKLLNAIPLILKQLLSLPPKKLDQSTIDLITRATAYKHSPLSLEEIETFNHLFPFEYFDKSEHCGKYASLFMDVLIGCFASENVTFADLLLEKHPSLPKISLVKKFGCSLLHNAIHAKQVEIAKKLIELGADVNKNEADIISARNDRSYYLSKGFSFPSPLYMAMKDLLLLHPKTEAMIDLIQYLLKQKASPIQICLDLEMDMEQMPSILTEKIKNNLPQNHPYYNKIIKVCDEVNILTLKWFFKETIKEKMSAVKSKCSIM